MGSINGTPVPDPPGTIGPWMIPDNLHRTTMKMVAGRDQIKFYNVSGPGYSFHTAPSGVHHAMCDGSVRYYPVGTHGEVLFPQYTRDLGDREVDYPPIPPIESLPIESP